MIRQTSVWSLVAVMVACNGSERDEHTPGAGPTAVPDAPPLPVETYHQAIGERFELADVVARVEVAECPKDTVRVAIRRVFKGDVTVGESVDVGDVACEFSTWTTVRGGWLGQPAILFARLPGSSGRPLRLIRPERGASSAWLFLASEEDQRQVEEVLVALAAYDAQPANRSTLIRHWLHSPNQHLRGIGLMYVQRSGSDRFVEDLFQVLSSSGSSLSVRRGARAALQDVLNRRNGTRWRYDPDDPMYDRLIAAHVRLASDPPADGTSAARTAVNALRFLAQRRSAIEGIWYNLDGSSEPHLGAAGIRCSPHESPAECEARWFPQHGRAAAEYWTDWYARGGHLRTTP